MLKRRSTNLRCIQGPMSEGSYEDHTIQAMSATCQRRQTDTIDKNASVNVSVNALSFRLFPRLRLSSTLRPIPLLDFLLRFPRSESSCGITDVTTESE